MRTLDQGCIIGMTIRLGTCGAPPGVRTVRLRVEIG